MLSWDIRSASQRSRPHNSTTKTGIDSISNKGAKMENHGDDEITGQVDEESSISSDNVIYHLILEGLDVSYRIDCNSNVLVEKVSKVISNSKPLIKWEYTIPCSNATRSSSFYTCGLVAQNFVTFIAYLRIKTVTDFFFLNFIAGNQRLDHAMSQLIQLLAINSLFFPFLIFLRVHERIGIAAFTIIEMQLHLLIYKQARPARQMYTLLQQRYGTQRFRAHVSGSCLQKSWDSLLLKKGMRYKLNMFASGYWSFSFHTAACLAFWS